MKRYLHALRAVEDTARPCDSPAQEGAIKECSNTAHEPFQLPWWAGSLAEACDAPPVCKCYAASEQELVSTVTKPVVA